MSELYPPESQRMDFIGHLEELRRRILICLVFFAVAIVVLWPQGYAILAWLEAPARGAVPDFIFLTPTEAFMTYCQAVLLASFIVSIPLVLYEVWAFLSPAVTVTSRRRILAWIAFALVCFLVGIVFTYEVLLPSAFNFLLSFGQGIARPAISVAEYISFTVALILIGGCVFEIPVILGLLTEVGILNAQKLRSGRRVAILIILIIAAIVTPTQDAFNMLLFSAPMIVLYEVGILLSAWMGQRKRPRGKE